MADLELYFARLEFLAEESCLAVQGISVSCRSFRRHASRRLCRSRFFFEGATLLRLNGECRLHGRYLRLCNRQCLPYRRRLSCDCFELS